MTPIKQGHLDGLCGIYSCLNAIKLVTDSKDLDLDNNYERACSIFAEAYKKTRFQIRELFNGMTLRQVESVLPKLSKMIPGWRWQKLRVFGTGREEFLTHLHCGHVILFGFGGCASHWSVVEKLSSDNKKIVLFDSGEHDYLPLNRIKFSKKDPPKGTKFWFIDPREVFIISKSDGSAR